jgi:hypothetical protein
MEANLREQCAAKMQKRWSREQRVLRCSFFVVRKGARLEERRTKNEQRLDPADDPHQPTRNQV